MAMRNSKISLMMCYISCLEFSLVLSLAAVMFYFTSFHIWLVSHGMTTTEYNNVYSVDKTKPKSVYDISFCENWRNTLGRNIFEWVLPFSMIMT